MLKIIEVRLEGFCSVIAPLSYRFDTGKSITILKGDVGSGKTTIVDAVLWGLYGVKSKKKSSPEPWAHLVKPGYKGTKVEVDIEKDGIPYTIIRCSEYKGKIDGAAGKNRLIILKEGKPDTSIKKLDAKKEVVSIIGYSYDLFKSAIVFGQNMDRFIQEDNSTKKRILEEAFRVSYLTVAQEKTQKLLDGIKKVTQPLQLEIGRIRDKRKYLKAELQRLKSLQQSLLADWKDSVAKAKTQVSNVEKELDAFKLLGLSIKDISKAIAEQRDRQSSLEKDSINMSNQLEQLRSNLKALSKPVHMYMAQLKELGSSSICSACGSKLKDISKAKARLNTELTKAKANLESSSQELENQSKKVKASAAKIQEQISTIKSKIKALEKDRDNQQRYQELLSKRDVLKANLDKISIKPKPIDTTGVKHERNVTLLKQLKKIKKELKEAMAQQADYEWLVKNPLSNSGLKAYIFDTMLSKLNALLKSFSPVIGFTVRLSVKLESAHKDIIVTIEKKGDVIPMEDLSGGQKQLTNLAIGLSFHLLQTENKPVNVLILDECFEGLNDRWMQIVADILSTIAKDKSIHLITHRNFNPNYAKLIEVTLVNGETKLVG